jgi:hypothetical protein
MCLKLHGLMKICTQDIRLIDKKFMRKHKNIDKVTSGPDFVS